MVGYNSNGPARDRVLRLMDEKDRIESEIREQNAVLESNNIGMHEPLVDDQGFPRNDIDVYKVRHARHRIICLQNDHKALMKHIEQGLAEVHSEFLPYQGTSQPTTSQTNGHKMNGTRSSGDDVMSIGENDQGFAVVTFVHNGSPADLAGLCEQDEVLQFGSVSPHNFSDITQVHDVVAHSVGQNVRLLVRRNNNILNLTVTPRPWAQPGLLGCQIVRRAN
ncbi:26S proteasome non-ATPase regulatory subunit 9 [Pectinophora gossypiella]|uniref:26S proteasome non-ATPase regulatory subunit 9 n=1 Tax=Pectinophora gossypiella TaxID=13191 RepID=UPI00214ED6B1|nr:26S proteasome non-ATPase regulatory subunit 9 [Pectinophora gossypiella]